MGRSVSRISSTLLFLFLPLLPSGVSWLSNPDLPLTDEAQAQRKAKDGARNCNASRIARLGYAARQPATGEKGNAAPNLGATARGLGPGIVLLLIA